jgi:cytoskeletal protein CcmA (bactofilin family)
MFTKNNKENTTMNKGAEGISPSINLIGAGTVIEGDVRSNGDIRVDGTVYGSVTSKAKVVIGTTGLIEGDVNSQNADVSGTVKGKSTVTELLFLKSTARIIGDLVTGKLVVEVGATFTGSCNMGPLIKDIKDGDKPTELNKEKAAYS